MIYPPNLTSTQPAFSAMNKSYAIGFTLPSYVAYNDIGHLQIRVVKQANNRSIVNTSLYPDGTIYKYMPSFESSGEYAITIDSGDLSTSWEAGTVYKVQMRFGTTALWGGYPNSVTSFATWKRAQVNNQTFSEWSTVMVIKAITPPSVAINNAATNSGDTIDSDQYQKTTTPLFEGTYISINANNEAADKFEFSLCDEDGDLIESSGELQYEGDSSIKYRFKTVLTEDTVYIVKLSVTTINGYKIDADDYKFTVKPLELDRLTGIDFYSYESDQVYGNRNGCVKLYLEGEGLQGNYVITRSCEDSGYTIWEDIKYLIYYDEDIVDDNVFTDFTIESGIKYKYAIQSENSKGLRSAPFYSNRYPDYAHRVGNDNGESDWEYDIEKTENPEYEYNFEYAYLYRDGVQLRLQFNQKMASFKHTVLRSKQDTLGDKYPHLVANGYANYAEFPINGLISLHMDSDQTFFEVRSDGLYYEDELIIPGEKLAGRSGSRAYIPEDEKAVVSETGAWEHKSGYEFNDSAYAYHDDEIASQENRNSSSRPAAVSNVSTSSTLDSIPATTDLTHDNFFIERKFREKVEEFLNSFTYKLYRSPSEGNIVVGLLNVSLTPKQELGRMIFEFSATAYEVADYDLSSLDKHGIIDIGSRSSVVVTSTVSAFGQINELYKENTNVFALANAQQTVDVGSYSYTLQKITSFWIDRYPEYNKSSVLAETSRSKIDFEIEELKDELSDLKQRGASQEEIEAKQDEIDDKEEFKAFLESNKLATTFGITKININNSDSDIIVALGRIYAVDEDVTQLTLVSTDYPVIINYTCELQVTPNLKRKETSAVNNSIVWGQVAGVFTRTPEVLRSYNFSYGNLAPYRVFTPDYTPTINELLEQDATNYNVFQTQDILAAIKSEVQKQVEYNYNTKFTYEEDGALTDGHIYYTFLGILEYSIEADPGTVVRINGVNKTLGEVMLADEPLLRKEAGMTPIWDEDEENIIGYQYNLGYYSSDNDLSSLTIDTPAFLIVNYKCRTREEIKETIGEED